MPKTPLILEARQRLRAFGDQLYYHAFVDELAWAGLTSHVDADDKRFTSDVFPSNAKAPRIHVPLSRLPAFRDAALSVEFGAVIVASYEVADSYAFQLPQLLARLAVQSVADRYSDVAEDNMRSALSAAGAQLPEAEVFETFKYIRLRRNHIAHLRSEPTKELSELIRQRGTHLMRYWKSAGPLDFSVWPPDRIEEDEAVGVLRYLRICVERIDAAAGSTLARQRVIAELDEELLTAQPHLRQATSLRRRASKLEAVAEMLFGILITQDEIIDLLGWGLTICFTCYLTNAATDSRCSDCLAAPSALV